MTTNQATLLPTGFGVNEAEAAKDELQTLQKAWEGKEMVPALVLAEMDRLERKIQTKAPATTGTGTRTATLLPAGVGE